MIIGRLMPNRARQSTPHHTTPCHASTESVSSNDRDASRVPLAAPSQAPLVGCIRSAVAWTLRPSSAGSITVWRVRRTRSVKSSARQRRLRQAQNTAQRQTNNPVPGMLTYRGRLGGRGGTGWGLGSGNGGPGASGSNRGGPLGGGSSGGSTIRGSGSGFGGSTGPGGTGRGSRRGPGDAPVGGTSSGDGLAHALQYGAVL
jgi:hypothetical protein